MIENSIKKQKHPQKATESFNVQSQLHKYQPQPDFVVELSQKIKELCIKYNWLVSIVQNDLQQYSRRNCLILHGSSESDLPYSTTDYANF